MNSSPNRRHRAAVLFGEHASEWRRASAHRIQPPVPKLLEHPRTRLLSDPHVEESDLDDEPIDDGSGDKGDDDEEYNDGGWDGDGHDGEDGGDHGRDDTPWVTVATYWTPVDAQIARLRLEGGGIDVIILDENLIATDWLYANAVGGIKLQVPAPAAARACALLVRPGDTAVARNDGQPVSDGQTLCPQCGSPDIYPASLSRRLSVLALFVCSLLLPLALGRRSRCAACGYEWR